MSTSAAADKTGTRQDLTDGGCSPHDPNLYNYKHLADACSMNGPLPEPSASIVNRYHQDGLLVFPHAFADQVSALDAAIQNLSTGRNEGFKASITEMVRSGQTPNFTSGDKIPWVQYEAGVATSTEHALLQPASAHHVRKLMGFVGYEEAIDEVVTDAKLEEILACLLNCRVDELELFQDMALLKPPLGREKPWHQDKAYFNISLDTRVVGCWIAIDEASCDNGCMRMLRGGHTRGPIMHFSKRDYQICDADAPSILKEDEIIAVPLPPGGLVLFDGMMPHGTPTNKSSSSRRALQFHWTTKGATKVAEDDPGGRNQIFGGTVNGLSC